MLVLWHGARVLPLELVPALGHGARVLPLELVPALGHGARVLPLELVPALGHGARVLPLELVPVPGKVPKLVLGHHVQIGTRAKSEQGLKVNEIRLPRPRSKHCVHCGICSAQNTQCQWPLNGTGFLYFRVNSKDSSALSSVLYSGYSFEKLYQQLVLRVSPEVPNTSKQ